MRNNIRVERAVLKMIQQQLADRVGQTINAMELNKYVPSTVLALKIASVFDKSVHDIFILEGSDWKR